MASIVSFYDSDPMATPPGAASLQVQQVPIVESAKFDLMQPETGVAYVRHPVAPQRLLPLASYHADIVIEKTNDAILLLTMLGASSIELNYSTEVSNEVRADLELLFGLITISGTKRENSKTNIVYTAKGTGAPPRPLPPLTWLDQPSWRGIVDARFHTGLREFALAYTYEHRNGVDTELVARVRKFGLRAGGDFRKAHKVAFNLRGEFPDFVPTPPAQPGD